jgi:AGCS family alanine or glycine:cation symporter
MALLFKICLRILRDYDDQRRAGVETPIFDSKLFPDLDLDPLAWPPLACRSSTMKLGEPSDSPGISKQIAQA